MQLRPSTVQVAPGDGLVARFGDVVLYTDARGQAAARLLAAAESAGAARYPGDLLASQLGTAVFEHAASAAVGAAAPTETGYLVLVHGPAVAMVETERGTRRITGVYGDAWATDTVLGSVPTVRISDLGAPRPTPDPLSDLQAGVVPAGGLVMVGAPRADKSDIGQTAVIDKSQRDRAGEGGLVQTVGTEIATDAVKPASITKIAAAIEQRGALVGPGGSVYVLDRSYVIGRSPLADETVRSAAASPIVVPHDPYISRVHAYLTVSGTEVYLRDANTASGTFVAAPGAYSWTRVGSAPMRLEPGCSVRVGEWIASYQFAGKSGR